MKSQFLCIGFIFKYFFNLMYIIMKKLVFFATTLFAITALLSSCNESKLKEAEAQNTELTDSLTTVMAAQDSLLSILTEITDGMNQIKEMEKILTTTNLNSETPSKKEEIRANMVAIQQALIARRQQLESLEKKLRISNASNAKLQRAIASLKEQISQQETTIAQLEAALREANIKIESLSSQVNELGNQVETVTNEKSAAEAEAQRVANEMNECFYVIGSNKELKANNIISKKFLGKTKVLEGDFDRTYFTKGDKRTLSELPLHAKNAKILTKHPAGSYEILDIDGSKVLKINNPTKFWELSNFLVIEIN